MSDGIIGLEGEGCRDLERATSLEWLDANGRGGYASGTVGGVATRRYHGLLLVARHPPHDRVMLVNHLSEWLESSRGAVFLSSARGQGPTEDGYRRCVAFVARPAAEWRYEVEGMMVTRTIVCLRGRDAVVVRWQITGRGAKQLRLFVRPMLTGRADHAVVSAADAISSAPKIEGGRVSWQPRPAAPRVFVSGAQDYDHRPEWRRSVDYSIDRERGEPCEEDWWSPGTLSVVIAPAAPAFLTFTTEDDLVADGQKGFERELERRVVPKRTSRPTESVDRLRDALIAGAESYVVEVGGRAALLAGFPWFDVWTRDTFTAFGGLLLVTGRTELAGRILQTFAPSVDGGLLPNNLPARDVPPRWTSVDASLWFVVAVGRYAAVAPDEGVLRSIWPTVKAIIDGYSAGTSHVSIGMDTDGLIRASDAAAPLTWMDAECDGRVMTPRRGKPVEVQALWVQALGVAASLASAFGDDKTALVCTERRNRAISSFGDRFWYAEGGYLYDVIDGPEGDDASLRPNQLFALSFDAPLVEPGHAREVLQLVRRRLLTPKGLRTLASDDPRFHGRYLGPRAERDAAYHQGTVWPFLLAPLVTAWLRFFGDGDQVRAEAASFLTGIEAHLFEEGCLGHLSEIFDGAAPHVPRGCFAQAWSLGEILLAVEAVRNTA